MEILIGFPRAISEQNSDGLLVEGPIHMSEEISVKKNEGEFLKKFPKDFEN